MYTLARQLLFKLSPETSHDLSLDLIGAGGRLGLNGLVYMGGLDSDGGERWRRL